MRACERGLKGGEKTTVTEDSKSKPPKAPPPPATKPKEQHESGRVSADAKRSL